MSITTYNINNSLSRFKYNKNWNKILFKGDKKLQTTEIEEVQDVINNQIQKAFSFLYNFYTIIKGCQVIIIKVTETTYECLLTEGQVYLEIKEQYGYFIDTKSIKFTIDRINTTEIGVVFTFNTFKDEPELRNSHTGGAAFGSEGSGRLNIESTIIISPKNNPYVGGFYPIALIKPKTISFVSNNNDLSDGAPDILYYRNEELTKLYNEKNLSTYIKKLIELRIYETTGDFVAEGLNCFINSKTNTLCISPGIAYINGIRIKTNYNTYYSLDPEEINTSSLGLNKQYLFYLTDKGIFSYNEAPNSENNLLETPANSIALCYLLLYNRDNLILDYSLIEAPTRLPSINEILNMDRSNEANNKELTELILKANLLNLTSNSINEELNGIFIDSFNNLDNSDIFFPEYNASILPAIQAISLPFTSSVKDNRNFNIDQSGSNILIETTLNENNELVPYFATIQGTETKLFKSPSNITQSSLIPAFVNTILVTTSPSIIYKSDTSTFVNYAHPDIKFLTGLEVAPTIQTPFNNNTYTRVVTVEGKGFPSLQDNIKILINNIVINNLNILKGTGGSINGTIKANLSGNVKFTFALPFIKNTDVFIVSLSYGNVEGAAQIQVVDPEKERVDRENTGVFVKNINERFNVINSGLSQIIQIVSPIQVNAIECTILDYPSIQEGDLLNVQICRVNSLNIPVECLGYGTISFNEVKLLTSETSILPSSIIKLNKPVILARGKYGIVFNTGIGGVKIGTTQASNGRIQDGRNFFSDPLKLEVMHFEEGWFKSTSIDNIACDLILHNPVGFLSSTIINVDTVEGEPFDMLDLNISITNDTETYVNVYVLDNLNNYQVVKNGAFFFKEPLTSTKIRIDMKGTNVTHPILNLDNLSINLINTKKEAKWISRNQEYESPYTNLSFSVDVYKPNAAVYKFYFSSNKGVSWQELLNPTLELINENLPLHKYSFKEINLPFTSINSEIRQRTNLRYKIEIEMDNLEGIYPFFKNIVSITS